MYIHASGLATPIQVIPPSVFATIAGEFPGLGFAHFQDKVLLFAKLPGSAIKPVLAFGAVLALLAAAACSSVEESSSPHDVDDLALVWEVWDAIHANFAAPESLESNALVGASIGRIMELGDIDPYPFLTDLGRMRGQVPTTVPDELTDLWRATQLYHEINPDAEAPEVSRILVQGMVDAIPGPSSGYLTAEQLPEAREQLQRNLEGSYLGIGARVVAQDGRILLFPFSDSPAEKAGIQQGDSLVAVNGVSVGGSTPAEVGEQVKGPEGTKVQLQLERLTEPDPVELEVFRGNIELDTVASQLMQGGIGYVRVVRFRDNTGFQVFEALERLNQFDMLACILDLRRNPGGSPDAAAEVAAQLLPSGSPFRFVETREGERSEHLIPDNDDRLPLDDLPMTVLIDGFTIGEAEALAAALQEAERATLVGVPTYGEGSDYGFVELKDRSALYIPTSRWYTSGGSWVGDAPVQPDIFVEYEDTQTGIGGELQFNTAYEYLDSLLPLFR